jgi:two-component system CheB/CheR fusion protein
VRLAQLFDEPEVREMLEEAQGKAKKRMATLTVRQREVALLIADGEPNKIIAHRLGIAERSVENHRAEIMRKTEARSFAALVKLVVLAG